MWYLENIVFFPNQINQIRWLRIVPPHRAAPNTSLGHIPYFSCVTFSVTAPELQWWSRQLVRCCWSSSFRHAFSVQRLVTWSCRSSIRPLCFSSSSCWLWMILFSSWRYSAALLGFSAVLPSPSMKAISTSLETQHTSIAVNDPSLAAKSVR